MGLAAHGSDLNPVAVLITKALIEIPPKFAGQGNSLAVGQISMRRAMAGVMVAGSVDIYWVLFGWWC